MPHGDTTDAPVLRDGLAEAFDLVERTLQVLNDELAAVGVEGRRDGPAGPGGAAARGATDDGSVSGSGPEAHENRAVRLAAARLARARSAELHRRHAELAERFMALQASVRSTRRDAGALRRPAAGPAPVADHVARIEEATRALLGARDTDGACAAAVEAARRAVPAAAHVGLLVDTGDGPSVRATGDPLGKLACALQTRLAEGPGPDALRDGVPAVARDLRAAEVTGRWPAFAGPAVRLGLRSVAAVPLPGVSRRPTAALLWHATTPGALGATELVSARLCAAQASVALTWALQSENLVRALASRDLIGQAKGVLMHAHGVDEQAAFEMLRGRSRDTNTKLVEVARRAVEGVSRRTDPERPGEPPTDRP
ncbi:GAF and ANTAR domain-containing protein [Pseudonocardia sp. RS010]|uniref:GAF and ANTAR domain-containing protein n=1 Tax=Pseudonocardia sp. RS010 TaxID=3385979 RepID=UPI0039A370D6